MIKISLILIAIIFIGLFLLGKIPKIGNVIRNIFIFFFFGFIFVNFQRTGLATFYLILSLFNLVVWSGITFAIPKDDDEGLVIGNVDLGVFGSLMLSLVIGGIFIIFMNKLSLSAGEPIIGVPTLQQLGFLDIGILSSLTIALVAYIENAAFFSLYEIFKLVPTEQIFGFFSFVAPLGISSLIFGLFHYKVYFQQLSSIFYAVVVFGLFLVTYIVTNSTDISDTIHYWWNALVGISKTIQIFL